MNMALDTLKKKFLKQKDIDPQQQLKAYPDFVSRLYKRTQITGEERISSRRYTTYSLAYFLPYHFYMPCTLVVQKKINGKMATTGARKAVANFYLLPLK